MNDADRARGLYEKFAVTRNDGGSEPGKKHDGCEYFVLDLTHDPYAACALRAYAHACANEYPRLSLDLRYRAQAQLDAAERIELQQLITADGKTVLMINKIEELVGRFLTSSNAPYDVRQLHNGELRINRGRLWLDGRVVGIIRDHSLEFVVSEIGGSNAEPMS